MRALTTIRNGLQLDGLNGVRSWGEVTESAQSPPWGPRHRMLWKFPYLLVQGRQARRAVLPVASGSVSRQSGDCTDSVTALQDAGATWDALIGSERKGQR